MAQCKRCGSSALFLRTSSQGLCARCREKATAAFETERARIKEALVFARCLKDPRDKLIHLRRAMNSVKTLARYDRLGYARMQPSPEALETLLEEKLREATAELEQDATADPRAPRAPNEMLWDSNLSGVAADTNDSEEIPPAGLSELEKNRGTRRASRKRAQLVVEMERGTPGLTEDISPQGLCVRSPELRTPGTRVHLTLHAPRGLVTTEGIVRWARGSKQARAGEAQGVMGLEFSEPPPELQMYG